MSHTGPKNLRIVCLCGQRMKVTPAMYGKPAKCVSCRQKWFVPEKKDLVDNPRIIYLKDHPELLRKTGVLVRSQYPNPDTATPPPDFSPLAADPFPLMNTPDESTGKAGPGIDGLDSENQDVASSVQPSDSAHKSPFEEIHVAEMAKNGEKAATPIKSKIKIPMDTLEPLQRLCSYEYAYKQFIERHAFDENSNVTDGRLQQYQELLRNARKILVQQIKSKHEQLQTQIAALESAFTSTALELRIGRIDLQHYQSQMNELLATRESLARLLFNLQAWQHVTNPYIAGGLLDVSLEDLPKESFSFILPDPVPLVTDSPLYAVYQKELQASLKSKSEVIVQREAIEKFFPNDSLNGLLHDRLETYDASLLRLDASISFYRERLLRLLADTDFGLQTLAKYRADVLERFQNGQLQEKKKKSILKDIVKAEEQLQKVHSVIQHDLEERTSQEPLQLDTPFPENVSASRPQVSQAALVMYALGVLFQVVSYLWLLRARFESVGIFLLMSWVLAFLQPIIYALVRHWVTLSVLGFLLLLQTVFIMGALLGSSTATPIYGGIRFFHSIDLCAMLLASGVLFSGLACGTAIASFFEFRPITRLIVRVLPGYCCACLTLFSYMYVQASIPTIVVSPAILPTQNTPLFTAPSESLPITPSPTIDLPLVERETEPAGLPTSADTPMASEGQAEEQPADVPNDDTSPNRTSPLSTDILVVSLAGVGHGADVSPTFRMSLVFGNGKEKTLTCKLGDTIVGEWKASEYNPATKKLTISDGNHLLFLSAGDSIEIPLPHQNGIDNSE